MKITYTLAMASSLLLAAGCAHEQRSYSSNESSYSGHEYNSPNTSATPSVGGSYSADGTYTSGGGGIYSRKPTYAGTVGANGTFAPNPTSDTSAQPSNINGAGTESDNMIEAEVRESLRQDPEIALIVPNIQIRAHNGAIILDGQVQSEEQKRQIFAKVQGVTGVVTVNNQLNVMAGPATQNPNGSPLNPTGTSIQSQPIYKDANGPDNSTNNTLNAAPAQGDPSKLDHQGNQLNPTSRPDSSSKIYHDSNRQIQNGQQQDLSNMNQTSNSVNGASDSLPLPPDNNQQNK